MTLQALPPGLAPDVVEKLRWQTFGHQRSHSIRSTEDLARFTRARGFVLCAPESGLHYPSVVEAAVGRPLLAHAFDERGSHADAWVRECVAARQVMHGVVVAHRATLVDRDFVGAFLALAEHHGDRDDHVRLQRQGRLRAEAAAICDWLVREARALSLSELESRLRVRGPMGRRRLLQSLEEVVQALLVVPVAWQPTTAADAFEPVCDLVPRVFGDELRAAQATSPESARQRIACRYLRNVLVEGCHEMARVLGWTEADTWATLQALQESGDALLHPSSRQNRHIYQAASTDLLPEA